MWIFIGEIKFTCRYLLLVCLWDYDVFVNAFDRIVQSYYVYKIELKIKLSRDQKHKASILIEKNEKNAPISVLLYHNEDNLIKKIELLRPFNKHGFYISIVKKFNWFDNNSFGLSINKDQLILKAYLTKNNSDVEIIPKDKTAEELEGTLRKITFREFNTEKDIVDWINK